MKTYPISRRGVLLCDRCQEQVYPGELVHFIDGYIICPECFFDFAFDYFADDLIEVSEILRQLRPSGPPYRG